jgi:hypothetical protein
VAASRMQSRFWYNPYAGVVRARVPQGASDAAALKMYNAVNVSRLRSLFDDELTR